MGQGQLSVVIDKVFKKVDRKSLDKDRIIYVNKDLYKRIEMEEPIVDYSLLNNYNFIVNNEVQDNTMVCTTYNNPYTFKELNKLKYGAIILN